MNNAAITWAYEAKLPETVKGSVHAVLVALCYSLNFKTQQCNPRMSRLGEITRLDVSTIKKAIRILKNEGLISLNSGKRLRKSNSYVINYVRLTKPLTASHNNATSDDMGEISPSANTDNGEISFFDKGENQPTEKINKYTNVVVASSSSYDAVSVNINASDAAKNLPPPIRSDAVRSADNTPPGKVDTGGKPIGVDDAYIFVDEHIDAFIDWGDYRDDTKYQTRACESLANLIALYANPTVEQLKDIIEVIGNGMHYNWYKVNETVESIEKAVENGTHIHHLHSYVMKSLRNQADDLA